MRKTLVGTVATALIVAGVIVLPSVSGAAGGPVQVTQTVTGAEIGGGQAVFKVHSSDLGNGAGTQALKVVGSKATVRSIAYYGDATVTAVGNVKVGTPNAQGISTLTGSTHDVSGSGKLKGVKGTFTVKGTFNTKTLVYHVTGHGTVTHP